MTDPKPTNIDILMTRTLAFWNKCIMHNKRKQITSGYHV